MKTIFTYVIYFFFLSLPILLSSSLNGQMLASSENSHHEEALSKESSSIHFDRDSISKKLLEELRDVVNYPSIAVDNCIEKKVVVHLSFFDETSSPKVEIYRDDLGIFQDEIRIALERIDFEKILPNQIETPLEFHLPVTFTLR